MSLVEFKTIEYQGSKQVVASDEIKEQILKTGIRRLERETNVSHHTIDRILKGENACRKTLTKIIKKLSIVLHETGNSNTERVRRKSIIRNEEI